MGFTHLACLLEYNIILSAVVSTNSKRDRNSLAAWPWPLVGHFAYLHTTKNSCQISVLSEKSKCIFILESILVICHDFYQVGSVYFF